MNTNDEMPTDSMSKGCRPRAERRRRGLPARVLSFAVFAGVAALFACHHAESQAEAAPAASAGDPTATAAADFHEETFELSLKPVGTYAAGKQGTAEIQLSAKAGYHCNDKYPYKFKVIESPGVKFNAPVFTKDAVQIETARAVMKVDFTPDSKGEKTLTGTFWFSLCSADRCLIEKRELALKVPVE